MTILLDLPLAPTKLVELGEGWHLWQSECYEGHPALIRKLDETRYVAVIPFLFTWGVTVGQLSDGYTYDDRWCYHDVTLAVAAASVWDGTGEPTGWHRHPISGRRRPEGDVAGEYVRP